MTDLPNDLEDAPPARKYVYRAIETQGPLTYRQLREWTGISQTAINRATSTLQDQGYLDAVKHPSDGRGHLYYLADEYDTIGALRAADSACGTPPK